MNDDDDDQHHMACKILPNGFNSAELNKKRKLLQYELGNSGLPWPKHKVRDLSGSLDKVNSTEEPVAHEIGDGSEIASENDSNSFIGGPDDNMTIEMDGVEQPLEPSNSSSTSGISKEALYSVESRSMKEGSERLHADLDEQCTVFGPNADDLELEDETIEDVMLYSNDVPPFLLSSGRWSIGQVDARLATRKPTIDQEFEQYFSSLML